ncbi:MAG: hypothetical protein HKL96_10650 [Phycisphaerales bacterium]|nr:hypothetical protein [Phycisphaerales bacterium]
MPTTVAAISCHAVSPWLSHVGAAQFGAAGALAAAGVVRHQQASQRHRKQ